MKLGIKDPKIQNPNEWQGENLLGFALMETRDIPREWPKADEVEWDEIEENDLEDSYHHDGDPWEFKYYDSTGFIWKDGKVGLSKPPYCGRESIVFYPQWDRCEESGTGYTFEKTKRQIIS